MKLGNKCDYIGISSSQMNYRNCQCDTQSKSLDDGLLALCFYYGGVSQFDERVTFLLALLASITCSVSQLHMGLI